MTTCAGLSANAAAVLVLHDHATWACQRSIEACGCTVFVSISMNLLWLVCRQACRPGAGTSAATCSAETSVSSLSQTPVV
jgi:hypothetical protein